MTVGGILVESHWWWLIGATLLGIAEMVVPGFFLIWIGGAAALTGLIALIVPLPVESEFVLFAVAATASVMFARRWIAAHPVETSDPELNDRGSRMLGRTVVVSQEIRSGEGRVRVDDGEWPASGPDAIIGSRVRIVRTDGARLIVEPEA